VWYKNIRSALFVLTQSTRVTDRRTDRQTGGQQYDSQDRVSIAASRGKNWFCVHAIEDNTDKDSSSYDEWSRILGVWRLVSILRFFACC